MNRDTGADPLNQLIKEEWFLTKVLGYLINFGLHECRLVCKQWKAVCSRLPVKLNGTNKEIYRVAQLFPEARTVITPSHFRPRRQGSFIDFLILELAQKLSKLTSFTIGFSHDGISVVGIQSLTNLSTLQSLKIHLRLTENQMLALLSVMHQFPKLKEIHVCCSQRPDAEPLRGLKTLESIGSDPLFNSRGQLLFPGLTNLTKLVLRNPFNTSEFSKESMEATLCYASTLQSLCICDPCNSRARKAFWNFVQSFSRLESLKIRRAKIEEEDSAIAIAALHALPELRSLSLCWSGRVSQHTEDELQRLFSGLKKLIDLDFYLRYAEDISIQALALLRNLTALSIRAYPIPLSDEYMDIDPKVKCWSSALSGMSKLESLGLFSNDEILSSNCFRSKPRLERVELMDVCLTLEALSPLETAPLMHLTIDIISILDGAALKAIGKLTQLESLRLRAFPTEDPKVAQWIEDLQGLKYLNLSRQYPNSFHDDVKDAIRKTFPNCRLIAFN